MHGNGSYRSLRESECKETRRNLSQRGGDGWGEWLRYEEVGSCLLHVIPLCVSTGTDPKRRS